MDDVIVPFLVAIGFIFGGLAGYMVGDYDRKVAVTECQKELPRNVNCKIIAVPVDKN
jgi:hypothetical protein